MEKKEYIKKIQDNVSIEIEDCDNCRFDCNDHSMSICRSKIIEDKLYTQYKQIEELKEQLKDAEKGYDAGFEDGENS